jgi:hypothetical protein
MSAKIVSVFFSVQTGSGAHPVTRAVGTLGVKLPGLEADHSPPSSAEVKNLHCSKYLHDVVNS